MASAKKMIRISGPVRYLLCVFSIFIFCLNTSAAAEKEKEVVSLPMASHLSKRYTDDLDGLIKKRYIRILTTFNRTNFFISGGSQYGFEYSLLKDYGKFLNRGRKRGELRVVLEFIPVERNRLIPALINGYGDIAAAGLTITPERLRQVDFTDPYLRGVNEVIVVHKGVKGLKSLDDLSGRKVFVRKSSSYFESLNRLNRGLMKKGLKPVRIILADENLETEDILELVNSGAIKITVSDSHIARIWSDVLKDITVLYNLKVRTGGRIAWMVRRNNPKLKKSLNVFLRTHKEGSLLGNIYFNRYYRNTKWIKNPLEKGERRKLTKYKKLFRKYASRYGFDWMLVMALAYQESGLDNNKKNPSGAVGIMQVIPRMMADKNVAISNVTTVENNIHAGVKYLAFLRDHYFDDKNIRRRDRVRFALASYNAGPAKIRRARKLALKMRLNPDRWFRNVEMAVLKLVGQETVRYVSNINKYYILFKLQAGRRAIRRSEKKKVTDE